MKTITIHHIKLAPVFGIGYWKDIYDLGEVTGVAHNILLPFVRIQFGWLNFNPTKS